MAADTRHCRRLSMSAAISQVRFLEAAMRLRTGRINGDFLLSLLGNTACMMDRQACSYEEHADTAIDTLNTLLSGAAASSVSTCQEIDFDGDAATIALPVILERCLHIACPQPPAEHSSLYTVNCAIDDTCYSMSCANNLKLPLLYLWQFQPELIPLVTVVYRKRLCELNQATTYKLWEGNYYVQAKLLLYRSAEALWYTLTIGVIDVDSEEEHVVEITGTQGLVPTLQERLSELIGVMNDPEEADSSFSSEVPSPSEEETVVAIATSEEITAMLAEL